MHWPTAAHGQALIITRNDSFAFGVADTGLEITTLDTETGARFLLHHLPSQYEHETISARELFDKLAGHPLALSQIAKCMNQAKCTISDGLAMFNSRKTVMHNFYSPVALWSTSFRLLDRQSRNMLGVLCFLAPDRIPQSLFELGCAADLPERLQFCEDEFEFVFPNICLRFLTLKLLGFGTQ
jgi:hypothetical protein